MPPTYANQADFEAYVEGWVTDDPAALDRLLERAERDLDNMVLGNWPVRDSGLKHDPAQLAAWTAAALSRATCAQAEYRLQQGEDFMVQPAATYSGGGVQRDRPAGKVGPKVHQELVGTGLVRLTARAGGRRRSAGERQIDW